MLNKYVAYAFRSLNANLLYVKGWPIVKFLKVIYWLSAMCYRSWLRKPRPIKNVLLTNVDRDIKMNVDVSKSMGAAFYWTGFHELKEWRFLHNHLRRDMVFVDVGANQGEYTLFAAKRLSSGSVVAFEPVDQLYQKLQQNIQLNNFANVTCCNFGLSDADARLPIYMESAGSGGNEGLGTLFQSESRSRQVGTVALKVFDVVAADLNLTRIDFIKIDVEGAELQVLKGCIGSIKRYRPYILLEVNDDMYRLAGYTLRDILDFFTPLNYVMHVITKSAKLVCKKDVPRFSNVVFVPK